MKVGDKVIFIFLGSPMEGEVIERTNKEKVKVKGSDGTIYPSIYQKPPKPDKKGLIPSNIWGYVVRNVSEQINSENQ